MADLQRILRTLSGLTVAEAAELATMLERRLSSAGQAKEAREVTIKVDGNLTDAVGNFTVGFLKFKVEGRIESGSPAGAGTLIRLGRIYGILTAAHVLHQMDENETVGLARFCARPHNRRLNLANTDRIVMWNEKDGEAPDIALLRIPEIDGRNLSADGAVFYDLGRVREFKVGKPGHRMSTSYAVVGEIGEWTEAVVVQTDGGKKLNVAGLFGAAKNPREFKEGDAELIEVEVDHSAGLKAPNSYGGMSGGGLWELHVELDEDLNPVEVRERLAGVAFRESDDKKRITSNGVPLIAAIKERAIDEWPDARAVAKVAAESV